MLGNMLRRILKALELAIIPVQENNWRPEILSGRFLAYYLVLIIFLKIFTVPLSFYFQQNIFFADIAKTAMLEFINEERKSQGLQPLSENPALDKAALMKAEDMIAKDYFSHRSPDEISPWYWFGAVGYKYNVAGENLAIGFVDSEEVYEAWMDSPSHRANIMNGNYQEVGIAVLKGDFNGNMTTIVVNLFGKPFNKVVYAKDDKGAKETKATREAKGTEEAKGTSASVGAGAVKGEILPETTSHPQAATNVQVNILTEEDPSKFEEKESQIKGDGNKNIAEKTAANPVKFAALNFIAANYYGIIQKIIYISLILIILLLLINIFVRFDIQHPDLILKTLGFAGLLLVFYAIDKIALLKLIPHNITI